MQVCDLKVLSDNDTNFDHLQLAGEKRTSEDSCLSSEMQSQESQSVQVGDLKVLCYVGNNLTTSKVQEVIRTSQARQSGPGKPLKTHA